MSDHYLIDILFCYQLVSYRQLKMKNVGYVYIALCDNFDKTASIFIGYQI